MYEIHQRMTPGEHCSIDDYLPLDHLLREKYRFKATSAAGVETRVFLEHGSGPLVIGDVLVSSCGKHIAVAGEPELLIRASCQDQRTFARACYHLGNRHVRIEIGDRWLHIKPDHVLEDMLAHMGMRLSQEHAPFAPEPGAYAGGGHHHH